MKSLSFWLVSFIFIFFIYTEVSPYLINYPIESQKKLDQLKKQGAYGDFYVNKTVTDKMNDVKEYLSNYMKSDIPQERKAELDLLLNEINEGSKGLGEVLAYFEASTSENAANELAVIRSIIDTVKREATLEEVQAKVKTALENSPFSVYISKIYGDRTTALLNFLMLFIFAFLFARDHKNQLGEILHTKAVKPYEYVLGKYLGALIPLLALVLITALVVDFCMYINFLSHPDYKINLLNIVNYTLLFPVVSLLFSSALVTFLALVFKNGFAVIPVYAAYYMFAINPDVSFFGTANLLDMLIRMKGNFLTLIPDAEWRSIYFNRAFYMLLTAILLSLASTCWKYSTRQKRGRKWAT